MAEQDLSDEAAKVLREAIEHQSFADGAIRDLLADALARYNMRISDVSQ